MECIHCEEEMECHDYYGIGIPGRSNFEKLGDIFKCMNEKCELYDEHQHTDKNGELYVGYPC